MQIHLSWEDPLTGDTQKSKYQVPVALGRNLATVLTDQERQVFAKAILNSRQVSRFHALIIYVDGVLTIEDRSVNGTIVNGEKIVQSTSPLTDGDTVQIGPYVIYVNLPQANQTEEFANGEIDDPALTTEVVATIPFSNSVAPESRLLFDPKTDLLYPGYAQYANYPKLPRLLRVEQVSIEQLKISIRLNDYDETEVVSIGGGHGSFAFVDTLRIAGMSANRIRVLGRGESQPYSRYRLICCNSQIPDHERLRSGSDSCPDNIWAFPSYALRESWHEFFAKGRANQALKILWQVFAEPTLADTYTPRSSNVFDAMEREAKRINWYNMWRCGHVCAIRKTTDERYVIVYRDPSKSVDESSYKFLVANYVHLSTGYTGVRFLEDLQTYRHETGDTQSIVNAYENHEQIYEYLKHKGGTVVVRGEGIVASRIIQRLYEIRATNAQVKVIHLVRSEKTTSHHYKRARRSRENGWEFQPFNWPKATWGGIMRTLLENASPVERAQLLRDWGGTTTARRQDWRRIIRRGLQELWYERQVGVVEKIDRNEGGRLLLTIQRRNIDCQEVLMVNFIIDATGLVAKPKDDPLLGDLVCHYRLQLNPLNGLHVANDFEVEKMRNGRGRMYVSGIMTLGGPYAPVDTFLGLQYVAQRIVTNMVQARVKGIHYLEGMRSLWQWLKWMMNQTP